MNLYFQPDGTVTCLYSEELPLAQIGKLDIKRFTTVEPDSDSVAWVVKDMQGMILFSSLSKTICLAWEESYFNQTMKEKL